MSQAELIAGVERLRPWFHCIDLGHGVKTKDYSICGEPEDHPLPTWEIIRQCLPASLAGKSLLDVGCNGGFYAVEARRRGASPVLGVDAQRMCVRQARFVMQALGLDIGVQRLSVYDLNPASIGQFDITLALGLLYHCKHPALALESLFQVTREMLILETTTLPEEVLSGKPLRMPETPGAAIYPVGYLENPAGVSEQAYNWFLPSLSALTSMLRTVGFSEVTLFARVGARVTVVCRKHAPWSDSRTPIRLRARIETLLAPREAAPGGLAAFRLRLENTGCARWLAQGSEGAFPGAVWVGAHLLNGNRDVLVWDFSGTAIPRPLDPGEALEMELIIRMPESPGTYYVEFDLVSEQVAWFEDVGSPTLLHGVVVV